MKITVLKKEVGKEPEMVEIENTTEALHEAVGGHFELIGSYVFTGNFVRLMNGSEWADYNCKTEMHEFYGTMLYIGALEGDIAGADESAIKHFNRQKSYRNLRKEGWVWC